MNTPAMTRDEKRELIKSQIIGGIGAIALGLGIYGLTSSGNPFHPVFTHRGFNITLLGIGVLFLVTEWFMLWPVLKALQARAQQAEPGDGT